MTITRRALVTTAIAGLCGASGQIATDAVSQAEPDGYTLLSTASTFIVNPILRNKPKPDLLKDFVAVSHTARIGYVPTRAWDCPLPRCEPAAWGRHAQNK